MAFYVVQFLTGLASAASLFLVASGLSIIFGVTRIVNFAHGAFYMLGAYVAFTLTEYFSGAFGFWGGIVVAALTVAALGAFVGKTAQKDGKGIMVDSVYRKGSDFLPSDAEIEKMRPKE